MVLRKIKREFKRQLAESNCMYRIHPRMFTFFRKKPPNERARGMATLKTISSRLKSVKNIQKITQSMKMVSAAKYTRAEKELRLARPLGYGIKLFYTNIDVIKPEEKDTVDKKAQNILYLAVTSDRGLCGGVHSSIAKIIRTALEEPGENIKIVCIGDKSRAMLQRLFSENFLFVCQEAICGCNAQKSVALLRQTSHQVGRLPSTFQDASAIATKALQSEFEFEEIKIVYNRFRSVVSYSTELLNFYNVEAMLKSPKLKNYEDVEEDTLLGFVEFSLATLIYYAMKEGGASEQSSRMTAMDNASKNAGDMISKLTLTFNRTRQAVITRELIEIISGASAL